MADLLTTALTIGRRFALPGEVDTVTPLGAGIINDTFLLTFKDSPAMKAGASGHFRLGKCAVLQRINRMVFPDPVKVMRNLEKVLAYTQQQFMSRGAAHNDEFLLPPLYRTRDGNSFYRDSNDDVWRALGFIGDTRSDNELQDLQQAYEAGVALGAFHRLLEGLPADQLYDTLPGFHVTPEYLRRYDEVAAHAPQSVNGNDRQFCRDVIEANRPLADILANAIPPLRLRIMHGDPKLNNILFDRRSGKAVSIVDLDTVKPGLIQYDIADCLRSCCNRSGELPENIADVHFDMEACRNILQGYMSSAGAILDAHDVDCLVDAIQLLPFELGLRFFTDYLQGNRYFKVKSADENLYRAKTQFLLLDSIQQQQSSLTAMIADIRTGGE